MELNGRVALVTGGAIRLGRAISLALAARGMRLVINYHSSDEEAEQTLKDVEAFGTEAIAIQADVSKNDDVDRMVSSAIDHFGVIDVLVNNAAIFYHKDFIDLTEEDFDRNISINLKGPY